MHERVHKPFCMHENQCMKILNLSSTVKEPFGSLFKELFESMIKEHFRSMIKAPFGSMIKEPLGSLTVEKFFGCGKLTS